MHKTICANHFLSCGFPVFANFGSEKPSLVRKTIMTIKTIMPPITHFIRVVIALPASFATAGAAFAMSGAAAAIAGNAIAAMFNVEYFGGRKY